jgi:uncharacterized protein DUF2795
MDTVDKGARLSAILSDLTYPAEKWRITACADIYGVDTDIRQALYALPARVYRDAEEVSTALGESVAPG